MENSSSSFKKDTNILGHHQTIVTRPLSETLSRGNRILITSITDEKRKPVNSNFPTFFPFFLSFFFFFLSPFHWPISPQEFSSIILDFCSPLCYAGYVGNVARNLEMVRGLQSPIFRGGMELHWVLGSFSPPLLPNLSLSSSPPFLSLPTVFFFSIFPTIFISPRVRFSHASHRPSSSSMFISLLRPLFIRLSILRIYDLFRLI